MWIVLVYLVSIVYGSRIPEFAQGAIIVMFPAVISYGRMLSVLTSRPLDIFVAILLCLALGLTGTDSWNSSEISDRQTILTWLPMFQLVSVVVMYIVFLRVTERDPIPVVFNMGAGKWTPHLAISATSSATS